MIEILPKNYNFEIHKSIWRIEEMKKELGKDHIRVVLQMPQGLQMFACALTDIFEHFTGSEVFVIRLLLLEMRIMEHVVLKMSLQLLLEQNLLFIMVIVV